jgi:hypothetical protein
MTVQPDPWLPCWLALAAMTVAYALHLLATAPQ